MLRSMGMSNKLHLRVATTRPVMKALARGRVLRGTPLDPFGRAHVRRVERALLEREQRLVEHFTRNLSRDTYDQAVAAVSAVEQVRGYEDVKLRNLERYEASLREIGVADI
jgi:indolepyruvate ferredoxin oxidoreductase